MVRLNSLIALFVELVLAAMCRNVASSSLSKFVMLVSISQSKATDHINNAAVFRCRQEFLLASLGIVFK
ncbi:TPA: hypothetical protein TVE63_000261 [Streptococcus equi subsp. zooepidemicus]|nr:hypothetical protein [Streptococcus equi subsp. zooepidemicus]HEL1043954.1 hypothetical protein [Streptococcus equi subsp. zooepidemicus]HEL1100276.1 hypothetical protein [Streptococcus equi subsp. zooepidemicus]